VTIIGAATLLLLHISSVVSRLRDQSETLAQRQALLDKRLRRQERLVTEFEDAHRPTSPWDATARLQSRLGASGQRSAAP
jgi:hypothetical protein